jgi:hypothetical protein
MEGPRRGQQSRNPGAVKWGVDRGCRLKARLQAADWEPWESQGLGHVATHYCATHPAATDRSLGDCTLVSSRSVVKLLPDNTEQTFAKDDTH